jgi:predicted AlkP superfamily pyrophosphatase or phosphodiesterase
MLTDSRSHSTWTLRIAVIAASLAISWGVAPSHAADPPHPKLIVMLVVDQLSSDLFNQYRPLYRPELKGLARLSTGVVFPRGHQSHAATETCPGHSTILTGSRPARTGIIANEWQNPNLPRVYEGQETFYVYCVEKPGEKGSDAKKKVISPDALLVPTLGARLKKRDAASRAVAVSGKDRSAVLLGGPTADLTLWWADGKFTTYAGRESTIPNTIAGKLNQKAQASWQRGTIPRLPAACAAKASETRIAQGVEVGALRPVEPRSKRWRATPEMDSYTVDAALAAVKALELGDDDSVDLLAVSLSANDYVGHYYGTAGAEMCAQQLALDESIGRLLTELDKAGIPYVAALTADHGGLDTPERDQTRGLSTAERIKEDLFPGNFGAQLSSDLGLAFNAVLGGQEFGSDVYINAAVPVAQREAVLEAAIRKYRAHPQVAAAFTKNELIAAGPPSMPVDEWTLLDRAKASFNPQRSGDLVVLLKPYVTAYAMPENPETDYIATHGSPWGYDRRVPILFWWKGVRGFEQPMPVETVDIAPTLAALIGLRIPQGEMDGRALTVRLHPE